ncbi:MAG: type IV toxin-antitoxin system AbiEi family antitoxin domain-containing protein, partial [Nocardioides sp.]|nr:type IV toxin-antitoxin system AbiEi family antitoxin domain-containing protein [Nocardioides sp.]
MASTDAGDEGDKRAEEKAALDREHAERLLQAQLRLQDGIVSRAQLTTGGLTRSDIARMVRHNDLPAVHRGVYANQTGPLTWSQRAWAAVLYAWPAYLCWTSLEEPTGRDSGPIHVAIDHSRRVHPQDGIVLHRMTGLDRRAYGGNPPRLAVEDNALAMAHAARDDID